MSSKGRFVCVFGVSGVGKSTLVRGFVSNNPDWGMLVASELLEDATNRTRDELRNERAETIEDNQYVLVDLVRVQRERVPSMHFILDAHCVIEGDSELRRVDVEVIRRLAPSLLVFIHDSPAQIVKRREKDERRRRVARSVNFVVELQALVEETCRGYAAALNVELHCIRTPDQSAFAALLQRHAEN
jgi:adenylate kinase